MTTDVTGPAPTDRTSRPAPLAYVAAGAICVVALTWALRLDRADFRVPFYYTLRGDAFEHAMWLKTTADRGWYYQDPRLGAPDGMDLHDYPLSDSLHFALVRMIARATSHYGVVVNVFYLLGYPLAAWTALFALRQFGVSAPSSTVAAVLFAFLPYHFLRGQGHILLSGYYGVPLMAVVVLRIWRGESLFGSRGSALFTVISCAMLPATGVYYAFFGAFLATVAAVASASRRLSVRRLCEVAAALALIGGSLAAQLLPSILYFREHGRSPEVAKRTAWEAEHFGLKIHQLLMPTLGHRLPAVQKFGIRGVVGTSEYDRLSLNDLNENETSSLGAVGAIGFLALISVLFVARTRGEDDLLTPLSRLTIAALVLGTVGGVGVIFSRLVSPQIRAYNRISVYIAFFALFAVALGLDALKKRICGDRHRMKELAFLGLILLVGLWDQCPAAMVPDHPREARRFAEDAAYVAKIEAAIPDRPMVFQLPYVAFPESVPVHKMRDYDHLWGYFHSDRLRWSYGAIKGRAGDLWQRDAAAKPAGAMVEALRTAGFGGVTVDRAGYGDGGAEIEAELRRITGSEPIVGPEGRVAFYAIGRGSAGPVAASR